MPGLINLGNGLSNAGASIAESAGQAGLLAHKAAMERQTLLLQDQLAGGKYNREAKALALVPQRLSIDTYLKAVGHPGGLAEFGMGDGAAPAQASQPAQAADSPPPQRSLINDAPAPSDASGDAPAAAAGGDGGGQGAPAASRGGFPNGAPVVTPIGTKGKIMGIPLPPGWTPQQAAIAGPEALQKAWSEWAKPQNMRANSTLQYFDFKSGQMKTLTRNPEMPTGYYYDPDTNSAVQINNAGAAVAASAKAKSYGESQGSLPADLTKIGAQGGEVRKTSEFQKGLDVATELVPSYDPVSQTTTMVTKAEALAQARGGKGVKAPPAMGGADVINSPGKPGIQKDGSYKTPSGTVIPPAPKIPSPDGGLQAAPSAADKATQETYAPIIKGWQDSVTPSIMAEQRFHAIAEAMKATETGAWASTKQDIAHSLMAHGVISADTAKSLLGADVGEAQIILKNNFGTALNTLSAARLGRITQNEIFAMQKNLPAIGNQPEANMAMIAQGIGTSRFQQAMANDWNIARQRGYADPLTYEAEWTKANPLQGFIDQAAKEVGSLKGMPNAFPEPPPDAIRDLKMRGKSAASQFDQIFGPGSADRVLGSK